MSDDRLLRAFVTFADTLVGDFEVGALLVELGSTCVALLDAGAAALVLTDQAGRVRLAAASDERARLLGLREMRDGQGPCLDCFRSGAPVSVTDLNAENDMWPSFVPAARDAGFSAVHALPLRLRDETIGAMSLFHRGATPAAADLQTVQALADVATIGILQHRAIQRWTRLAEQLQAALASRLVIEQAKGLLAERGRLDLDAAFDLLRRYARERRSRLSDVARRIVQRDLDADEVLQ